MTRTLIFFIFIFYSLSIKATDNSSIDDLTQNLFTNDPILQDLFLWANGTSSKNQFGCYNTCINQDPNTLESLCEEPTDLLTGDCSLSRNASENQHKSCAQSCGL